jgi:hypothetical protein
VRGARSSAPHRLGTRDGQDLHGGQVVRHACDSALCCNPRHLIAAPIADGIATRVQKNQSARGAFNGRAQVSNSQVLGPKPEQRADPLPGYERAHTGGGSACRRRFERVVQRTYR